MPLPPRPSPNGTQVPLHHITPALRLLAVSIDTLKPDPNNARYHGERSTESIMDSLKTFGQLKPVVVRRGTNIVVAGNGTLEAARRLGWTHLAATFVDFNDVDAMHYALVDNRSAELSRFDLPKVSEQLRLIADAGKRIISFSPSEILVLRADADWKPPDIADEEDGWIPGVSSVVRIDKTVRTLLDQVLVVLRSRGQLDTTAEGTCLGVILQEWLESHHASHTEGPPADYILEEYPRPVWGDDNG